MEGRACDGVRFQIAVCRARSGFDSGVRGALDCGAVDARRRRVRVAEGLRRFPPLRAAAAAVTGCGVPAARRWGKRPRRRKQRSGGSQPWHATTHRHLLLLANVAMLSPLAF